MMDEVELEPEVRTSHWAVILGRVFAVVAVVALLVPLVLLVANVVMRAMSWGTVPSLYEICGYSAAIVGAMGFGYAAAAGGNVSTTILTSRLKGRPKKLALVGGLLVTLVTATVTTYALVQRALDSYEFDERLFGAEWLAIWPARTAVALGIGVVALVALDQVVQTLRTPPQDESATRTDTENRPVHTKSEV